MKARVKYILLPIFVILVFIGMFFIYSNIGKVERIEYFKADPGWGAKLDCLIRGGKIEPLEMLGLNDVTCSEEGCVSPERLVCHFR